MSLVVSKFIGPYDVYSTLLSVYTHKHSEGVMYINEIHEDCIYILLNITDVTKLFHMCSGKLLDTSPKIECFGKLLDVKIKTFQFSNHLKLSYSQSIQFTCTHCLYLIQ